MTRSRRSCVCSSDQTRIAEPTQPTASSHGVPMGATLALPRLPVRGSARPGGSCPTTLSPTTAATMPASRATLTSGEALPAGRHGPRHRERRPETRPHGIRRPDGDGAHGAREADHAERAGDEEDDGRDGTREALRRGERRGPDRFEHGADEQDDPRHHATALSPATQATRTSSRAARAAPSRSSRRATASRTVPTAPIPTHTAYAVPGGQGGHRPREADHAEHERDGEEGGRPGTAEAVGRGERGGPDGLQRAGEDEDEPVHGDSDLAVLSQCGYGSLVREHGCALTDDSTDAARPGRKRCIRGTRPAYCRVQARSCEQRIAMSRDYLDFDVAVTPEGQGYAAHVLASPAGDASAPFTLPFSATDLAQFMIAVGPPRVSSRRLVPAEARVVDVKEYGRRLGDALLSGDVGRSLPSQPDRGPGQWAGPAAAAAARRRARSRPRPVGVPLRLDPRPLPHPLAGDPRRAPARLARAAPGRPGGRAAAGASS